MRVLFVTWDGAGNLPPTLALISALASRGHEVIVLGHDSQEKDITQSGGHFRHFDSAPQLDQGSAQAAFDFPTWFATFNEGAARDFFNLAMQVEPNVNVVDCMMGSSLSLGWSTGINTVALVHAPFSAMAQWSEQIGSANISINCSYEDFDKGTRFPRNMTFVGPLRPSATARRDAWKRRSPDRPLVVASLSTGIQGSFQTALLQRVSDALASLPVEGLITTGRGIDPADITAPANVSLERYIDHELTLPQASLFITHGGHGSIMASLRAGVPMLCLPAPIADQPHNATLIQSLELGEVLDVMAPVQLLSEAITRLLGNKQLQKAAEKFGRKKTYTPKLDKAVKLIEKTAAK